jgi:hypothetical protein
MLMAPLGFFALTLPTSTSQGRFLLIAVCGSFVGLSVHAVIETLLTDVLFSDSALMSRSRLSGRIREIPWHQMSGVAYSRYFHWFRFKSFGGERIRVSRYRIGFNEFESFAEKHLPPGVGAELSALTIVHLGAGLSL